MKTWALIALLALTSPCLHAHEPQTLPGGGRFGEVTVYRPEGTITSVVLFVSGDGGWHLGVVGMARAMVDHGALVVGIDVRHYLNAVGEATASCVSLAVDFEQLSHDIQRQLQLPAYIAPILAGYSSGATVVYATLAQAPAGTFAGGVSFGFCADQDFRRKPLCPGAGLHYTANKRGDFVFEPAPHLQEKWVALQGQQDVVCNPAAVDDFVAHSGNAQVVPLPKVGHGFSVERNWLPQFQQAFDGLQPIAHTVTTRNVTLAGLPVIEVPVVGAQSGKSNRFALIVSGDGGWAGLDRDVAAQLTRNDVPVVGLDSLRYFWKARTPEETAADVARILEHYAVEWHKDRILLIGYSFGADVLPFIATRLPPALRDCIESITLISPSQAATFEFHLSNWLPGSASEGLPLMPEIMKLERPALCLFGKGDTDTVCDAPSGKFLVGTELGPGHHLGGDSVGIVSRILNFAQRGQ